MIRRIFYFLLSTIVLGGLAALIAYYAFDFKPKMLATMIGGAPRPAMTIAAEDAREESWQPLIGGIGTLEAPDGIDIAPQVGGRVAEVFFESGSRVKKGAKLVQLDTDTEMADIKSLRVQYANADKDYVRKATVFKKGFAARASVDDAKALRDQLAASIERLEAVVAQKTVVAPFEGQVGLKAISVGSYLAPGQKIAWLQKTDPIYADFTVTEGDYGRISIGQEIAARFNAWPGEVFKGKVLTADSRMSDASRMITVRAQIDNADGRLLPGMYADVAVSAGAPETVISVPQTAVTFSLYGDTIFVVVPAKKLNAEAKDDELAIEKRVVKAGQVRDGRIAISKGIAVGEKVVIAGQNKIDQGSKVIINNDIALKQFDPNTLQ